MKTMKKIITLSIAALLIATLGSNISIAGKPIGGNGKVTVESANPNSAVQGEEKDVLISGSGFGHGAKVKYLVTGTKDDSQIEVLSVEYIDATGELRSRIKVKGSAEVIDYDIEVQSISGRKGKGTTLFKVNSAVPPNWALLTGANLLLTADGAQQANIFHQTEPVSISTPVWLVDGSYIAGKGQFYEKPGWGPSGIIMARPDGTDIHAIFQFEENFKFSAREAVKSAVDGCGDNDQLIYFMAGHQNSSTSGWVDIYSVNPFDISTMKLIVQDASLRHRAISISNDGTLLALWS